MGHIARNMGGGRHDDNDNDANSASYDFRRAQLCARELSRRFLWTNQLMKVLKADV